VEQLTVRATQQRSTSAVSQEPLNIALPDSLKDYLFERVSQGVCNSPSEYIVQLIRADQKHKVLEDLETLALEGIESGDAGEMTDEEWTALNRSITQPQLPRSEP